jgi:hypothetical protein
MSSTLPTLLSPTTPPLQPRHLCPFTFVLCSWPQVRGPDFVWEIQGLIPSWVMTQASPVPSKLAGRRGRIGFTLCHVHHVTLLRTGCSPPAALHPVLPRRSSLRLQAGETFRLTGTFTPRCARFHRRTRDAFHRVPRKMKTSRENIQRPTKDAIASAENIPRKRPARIGVGTRD